MSDIHAEDHILRFVLQHPNYSNPDDAVKYYFDDGHRSAEKLRDLLVQFGLLERPEFSLLDFASGYGCVSRHFANVIPEATVTVCDIHSEAVSFAEDALGLPAILSAHDPFAFTLPEQYDCVFALSFFSHMPRATWSQWLEVLWAATKPDGLLMFTTHGLASAKLFGDPPIPSDGFWFQALSEQADLSTEDYGSTLVTPDFVHSAVAAATGFPVFKFLNAHWWTHQDLYVLRRR